jgi:hypothetical protein
LVKIHTDDFEIDPESIDASGLPGIAPPEEFGGLVGDIGGSIATLWLAGKSTRLDDANMAELGSARLNTIRFGRVDPELFPIFFGIGGSRHMIWAWGQYQGGHRIAELNPTNFRIVRSVPFPYLPQHVGNTVAKGLGGA